MLMLIFFASYSQNYTFTSDLKAEHYQYNNKVKQTDWKPCNTSIVITKKECVITDISGIKTYKIISTQLNFDTDTTILINATYKGKPNDLKLISSGDDQFHFLITN